LTNAGGTITGVTTVQSTAGGLGGELISRHNFISAVSANGGVSAVIAAQNDIGIYQVNGTTISRWGGIQSTSTLSGDVLALGNIWADIGPISGGLKGGRIAAQGQPVTGLPGTPSGILGNVNGSLDANSAVVSGGMIGYNGTGMAASSINGIVAANGSISPSSLTGSNIFANAAGTANGAVVNSIFVPGSFDQPTPLAGLTTILTNLTNLHIASPGTLGDIAVVTKKGPKNGLGPPLGHGCLQGSGDRSAESRRRIGL
jgi:hypothetical protein